jgi:hypothetical protein
MPSDDEHSGASRRNRERLRLLAAVAITAAVTFLLTHFGPQWIGKGGSFYSKSGNSATVQSAPSAPAQKSPLDLYAESRGFKSVLGDAVFVTKDVYGGDLSRSAILKGKVRNVSDRAIKNVIVLWVIFGPDKAPLAVSQGKQQVPSLFSAQIEYLDAKAEADFSVAIDLYSGWISSEDAPRVRGAIINGEHEAGLFVKLPTP